VLVEAEQRAQAGLRERRARSVEAVVVQASKVDPLLEIDLRAPGRLERAVPAVLRVDVVRTDDARLAPLLLRHLHSSCRNSIRR
jgi:hypothetical protein